MISQFLDSGKWYLFGVLFLALVSFLSWSHKAAFEAGEAKTRLALEQAHKETVKKRVEGLEAELNTIKTEKIKWQEIANELENRKPAVQYVKIKEIVENPNCTNRGRAFIELWNSRADQFRSAGAIISGKDG